MDNMLQMQILSVDSRNLYIPTAIKRILIQRTHKDYVKSFGEKSLIPVYAFKEAGLIRSGGIQISGLKATAISRRKVMAEPVLEKYVFVPNEATLSLQESTRIITQIILEIDYNLHFKAVELIDETVQPESILPFISEALADLPLTQPELIAQNEAESLTSDIPFVIGTKLLEKDRVLQAILAALKPNGFILSLEDSDFNGRDTDYLKILTIHTMPDLQKLVLLRKSARIVVEKKIVHITDDYTEFEWLSKLKAALERSEDVVLYSQNETSGIVGLTKCLRMEFDSGNVGCVFIMDSAPDFDPKNQFYSKQLSKGFAFNVFKNGKWGTFRHLSMQKEITTEVDHCFAKTTASGDLSSVKWFEGPLTTKKSVCPNLVHVYYASLNFRDIMVASARISADVVSKLRTEQYCLQGLEFAGYDGSGRRVMGIVPTGALSSLVLADPHLLIPVPDHWSLEEAATVPVVYATVIYSFFMRTRLKRGQSVLIHAGSGGVGQAAINIALSMGCEVYTTVGTEEKRKFLKNTFPKLNDAHIGNSRDTTFEQMVMRGTRGRGVDVVLNSLAEEKLQASLRCLRKGGTFLEIGKFDLESDNELPLGDFDFHGAMVDQFMTVNERKKEMVDLINKGIDAGAIKPLARTIFEKDDVDKGFRYMASGKHIGKVVIKVRNEGDLLFKGLTMYHCDPESSYVIAGGLGGFGLELADWLVLRGARKLLLTSRHGIKTGYQLMRINIWKSYKSVVEIATDDITTEEGCKTIISKAKSLGPVQAVFNLAVVLRDAALPDQNVESFQKSFGPKAIAVQHFDKLTREMCPQLRDFVVFSSASCGRGNPGQTNYGMANSVMERICEQRKRDGLPALAIQWGAVGEVGLVAEMQKDYKELKIAGTLQQRINSCLEVLDVFLKQPDPVVSSMVVAEKKNTGPADNIVEHIANIIGIRDVKTISLQSTLPELGLDSMTAIEIKQTLESEFDVYLTAQEIRNLTFARLQEIQNELDKNKKLDNKTVGKKARGLKLQMILNMNKEEELPEKPVIELSNLKGSAVDAPKIFLLPGIEGSHKNFDALVKDFSGRVFCLQYISQHVRDSIQEIAWNSFTHIKELLTPGEELLFLAHSFGCLVLLELLIILENNNFKAKAILMDGAPEYLIQALELPLDVNSVEFELASITILLRLMLTDDEIAKHKESLAKCRDFEERIDLAINLTATENDISRNYKKLFCTAFHRKMKSIYTYKPTSEMLSAEISLFRPEQRVLEEIAEDYNLSKITGTKVDVKFFKGDHFTMLLDSTLPNAILEVFKLKNCENKTC